MEEILKTFIETLFSNDTIQNAQDYKNSGNKPCSFDEDGILFRLQKAKAGNINLEVFSADERGEFYKPIGFYEFDDLGKVSKIYVLNEFEQVFKDLKNNISNSEKGTLLSLIYNVYIALASREVATVVISMFKNQRGATKIQSNSIKVNGLKINIKPSIMDSIEALYNDENDDFNGEDMLVIFQNDNGISVHSSEKEYQQMMHRGLLSAFNVM